MTKRILIETGAAETRAALQDGDRLVQYQVQPTWRAEVVGSIYRGVVRNVNRSLEAAFLDLGLGKDAFLNAREWPGCHEGRHRPLHEVLKPGQVVLVQVAREAIGGKGATVTGYVSLPGRYLVLVPENERSGISRKLSDKERDRLRRILDKVALPKGLGVIVRTAGADKTRVELEKDLGYLLRLWADIEAAYQGGRDARLLYREGSLPVRFVRELFDAEVKEIRVNDARTHHELQTFVKVFAPRKGKAVVQDDAPGLFRRLGVEAQIEQLSQRRVRLPSGGQLVIDPTEALTAIDVNSARTKGKDADATLYKTNLEAAAEAARQVILRDIGGLIVIDFIDMETDAQRKEVEAELKRAFASDKARIHLGRISEFGLFELSRQRLRPELRKVAHEVCPRCDGAGFIKPPTRAADDLLVRISVALDRPANGGVLVEANPDEARHLLNARRRDLLALEDASGKVVEVRVHPDAQAGNARLSDLPIVAREPEPELDELPVLTMYSARDVEDIRQGKARPEPEPEPEAEAEPENESPTEERPEPAAVASATSAPEPAAADDDEAGDEPEADEAPAGDAPVRDEGGDGRRKRSRRSRRGGRNRNKHRDGEAQAVDAPAAPPIVEAPPAPAEGDEEADDGADEPDTAQGAADAAAGNEPSGDRKRRSRRRRKRHRGKGGAAQAEAQGTEASEDDDQPPPLPSERAPVAPAPAAKPVADDDDGHPDEPPPIDHRAHAVRSRFAPKGGRAYTPKAPPAPPAPAPESSDGPPPAPAPVSAPEPVAPPAPAAEAPAEGEAPARAKRAKRPKKGWIERILDVVKDEE